MTNPVQRAANLFNALRELCGAETKEEAEALLEISETMSGTIPEAADSAKALKVLIDEWPENESSI